MESIGVYTAIIHGGFEQLKIELASYLLSVTIRAIVS